MGGGWNGHSHRNGSRKDHEPKPVAILALPKIASLGLDMDPAEARRLQLWGEAIIADIRQWRHREKRRREGVRA